MKNLLVLSFVVLVSMSGCAQKQATKQYDDGSYQRANAASAQALDKLDRE